MSGPIFVSNPLVNELEAAINSSVYNQKVTDVLAKNPIINEVSLGLTLGMDRDSFVTDIIKKNINDKNYMVHNGLQITNIPLFSEILRRIIVSMYLRSIQVPLSNKEYLLDTWKHIPPVLEDAYITSLNVPSGLASKWDARVNQIRDALAKRSASPESSGSAGFDLKNTIAEPKMQTVTVLSTANPSVANAVYRQNDPQFVGSTVVRPVSFFSLGVNPMTGGSVRNLHAPLYPKMVMNGGAHPFAVMSGGESSVDNMMTVINGRIETLKQQYKSVAGEDLPADLSGQITGYVNNVKSGFEGLEKDLKNLRDASGYLAQNPMAEGLPRPTNSAELETLAQKGREITEKSLKLSKQFGKVSKIESLLEELIKQFKPRSA